jgi:preprotein translocase subunit SecG
MVVFFVILVVIAAIALGFIVLIQNPKGGGVSGALGGFSNQLIGVKQSTDVMEKGTWIFAALVGILCIVSPAFISKDASASSKNDDLRKGISTKQQNVVAPTTQDTIGKIPGAVDTTKK